MRNSYRERRRRAAELRRIAHRFATGERASRGSLSRLGTLRHAVRNFSPVSVPTGVVLLDHNRSKRDSLRTTLGIESTHLDPFSAPLTVRDRLRLALSVVLPRNRREAQASIIIADASVRLLPCSSTAFLWNPYSLLQFAVASSEHPTDVYLLAPNYPVPRNYRRVYCNKTIREIHHIPDAKWINVQAPIARLQRSDVIRIYPTRLDRLDHRNSEVALLKFALWLDQDQGLPVEIFLHYKDQEVLDLSQADSLSELSHLIKRGHSLRNLSPNQISFSATSTIGFELLSQGVAHIFVTGRSSERHVPGEEVEAWFNNSSNVVSSEDPWSLWMEKMVHVYPEQYSRIVASRRDSAHDR